MNKVQTSLVHLQGVWCKVTLVKRLLVIVTALMVTTYGGIYLFRQLPRTELPVAMFSPNCSLLFNGDSNEIKRVRAVEWMVPSDEDLYQQLSNCGRIHKVFKASNYYVSDREKAFPLAFALSVYSAPYQIVRFLKVIYRPHNVYCLHYDKKSPQSFKDLMITLTKCLPNVIVPQKTSDVVWAWHTIVDAQLNCMEDLYAMRNEISWKYVITLCGKEVPLRTNREMVENLDKLNGTSAVDLSPHRYWEYNYWKYKHVLLFSHWVIRIPLWELDPVPFDLKISKSASYYALSDSFVDYLLHNKVAVEFRKFMEDTYIPDEQFVATLFNRTGVPGGLNERYTKLIPEVAGYIWITTVVDHIHSWLTGSTEECSGWIIHHVCVLSSGDLHRLHYRPISGKQTFFHNKFFIERDRVVMDCAEQELIRRNMEEYQRDSL